MFTEMVFMLAEVPPAVVAEFPGAHAPRTAHEPLRVLVVDDEHLITDTICAILQENGFEAVGAYNGVEAIEAARSLHPDVVLSDVLMPRMSGVELGIRLRREYPGITVFLFSGQAATSEMIHRAEAEGHHFDLFPKPIHPEELMARLRGLY